MTQDETFPPWARTVSYANRKVDVKVDLVDFPEVIDYVNRLQTQLKQIADLTAPAANSNCLCPYCQVYRIATKGPV